MPDSIHDLFAQALVALDNYHKAASDVIVAIQQQYDYEAIFEGFEEKFGLMEKENESISGRIDEWTSFEEKASLAVSSKAQLRTLVCSIFTILCVSLIPIFAWRSIFQPLHKMTSIMERIKDGDFDIQIEEEKRQDEIGSIAVAVSVFRDSGKERVRLEKGQVEREARAVDEQKRIIKEQENIIAAEISDIIEACKNGDFTKRLDTMGKEGLLLTLSESMNTIGEVSLSSMSDVKNALDSLAHGDLTQIMKGNYKGIFEEIKNSFNPTVHKLSGMVADIAIFTAVLFINVEGINFSNKSTVLLLAAGGAPE